MLQLLRAAVALALAAWFAAASALPPCAEDLAAQGCASSSPCDDGAPAQDSDGCDDECAACGCCRPPLTPASRATVVAPALAHERVAPARLLDAEELTLGGIFQPPRA